MTTSVVHDRAPVARLGFERLRSSREVSSTLRGGRRRAGRVAVVHAVDSGLPVTRLTVVAGRKVGSAVRRNRAKRLLREAARGERWAGGHDVVLVARDATGRAHARDVAAEVRELAGHLGLLARDDVAQEAVVHGDTTP